MDSNFGPGAATWQTRRNIRIVFDSVPLALSRENMTLSTKPEAHNILPKEDRAMATCNMYREFRKI